MDLTNRNIPKWVEILLGVVFILFGIMSLNRPGQTLGFLILWFGFLAIFRGIAMCINTLMYGREAGTGSILINLLMAVLDFLIGWLLVTNLYGSFVFVGIVFAVWFIIDSITNIVNIQRYKGKNIIWKILLFLFDLVCLAIGIMLLFNPVVGAMTLPILIGIYAIVFGTMSIMLAFRHTA